MYTCVGWWFEVTLDPRTGRVQAIANVGGDEDELLCYDDVFEGSLLGKVNCLEIIDVQEKLHLWR